MDHTLFLRKRLRILLHLSLNRTLQKMRKKFSMKDTMLKPCKVWAEKLAATLSDDLSSSEQIALESHLQECSMCAAMRNEYLLMDTLIRDYPAHETLPDLAPPPLSIWEPRNYDGSFPSPALDRIYKESVSNEARFPEHILIPQLRWAQVVITIAIVFFIVTLILGIYLVNRGS